VDVWWGQGRGGKWWIGGEIVVCKVSVAMVKFPSALYGKTWMKARSFKYDYIR
jgi:hypothetical protein